MIMETENLTPEQIDEVQQIAATANEKLDSGSLGNATRALNLGCSITFIPGIILVVLVFLLSRFNWVMAALTLVMVVIISMLFANLASNLARTRSMERIYRQEVNPEIEKSLAAVGVNRDQFEESLESLLPSNAPLIQMISQNKNSSRKNEP